MGLFNFLKPRPKINQQSGILSTAWVDSSIADTQQIVALFQIPKNERNQQWQNAFYQYIPTATLGCGEPKIITGPDGFCYFVLQTPQASLPFESYCLQQLKGDMLDKGLGVIINLASERAEWVFSHGDMVNLYLNNEFVSETESDGMQHLDMTKKLQVIKKGEAVMIGQPSERYLPLQTRKTLKKFLQSKGISRPMTMLLCRKMNGIMIQELAINVHPEDFPAAEERNYLMQQIGWFLPRHYLLISFSKSSVMMKHFADL